MPRPYHEHQNESTPVTLRHSIRYPNTMNQPTHHLPKGTQLYWRNRHVHDSLCSTVLYRLLLFILLFFSPLLLATIAMNSSSYSTLEDIPKADAAIIFGTLVDESGMVSPLLQERLDAGKKLFESGKVQKIVVSNTPNAAEVMAKYLKEQGIESLFIEVDTSAEITLDSCAYEKQYGQGRAVIFVSQSFHLPRLMFLCRQAGVIGSAFRAEIGARADRSQDTFATVLSVRFSRLIREATLFWLTLFYRPICPYPALVLKFTQ